MARTKKKSEKPAAAVTEVPAEAPEPVAVADPVRYERDDPKRSVEEEKAIRVLVKKAEKAIATVVEVLETFEPAPERSVKNALKRLRDELNGLKPPEPRKCKEYKRALALAKKGEMGIHPDDIMRYCRCSECHVLREQEGLSHPPPPQAA